MFNWLTKPRWDRIARLEAEVANLHERIEMIERHEVPSSGTGLTEAQYDALVKRVTDDQVRAMSKAIGIEEARLRREATGK